MNNRQTIMLNELMDDLTVWQSDGAAMEAEHQWPVAAGHYRAALEIIEMRLTAIKKEGERD